MAGGKIGYMHSTMARDGDVIHTSATTKMRIGRIDSPVEIHMTQTTTETLAGTPLAFGSEMRAAAMKTRVRGTVAGGRVTIITSQLGMEQRQTFDYATGSLMTWGQFRESILRGFKPGTEYTTHLYAPELRLDGPIPATTKVGDWEEFEHHGKRRRGQLVTVTLDSPAGPLEMKSWVDREGWPIKAEVPAPGLGNMVIITTDQATALADFIPPEIFLSTVIKAKRNIDPKTTRRVRYRISATRPDVELEELPSTGMQKATKLKDGSIEVVVTRRTYYPPEPRVSARADTEKGRKEPPAPTSGRSMSPGSRPVDHELAEYLEPNLLINTADPELISLAGTAGGGESDPYLLADRLRRFVANYVRSKSLNVGFATASEVCRTREGDCSEHGVLLAALGRINGLPSRVAVGLAYVPSIGGRNKVFGYHMWTQFYIDGRWIDFDAALTEPVCSPTRIAFATSSLKQTGLADLSLPLLSKIGAIDIDILEIETDGRPAD